MFNSVLNKYLDFVKIAYLEIFNYNMNTDGKFCEFNLKIGAKCFYIIIYYYLLKSKFWVTSISTHAAEPIITSSFLYFGD